MPVLDEYVVGARRDRRPVADVYEAVHRYTGAPFLVYVLRPRAMADRALVHRVGCEIDAARWIRHAAIPTLSHPGETPSRRLYVAVEHRAAPSLRAVVSTRGALPAYELVGLAAPLVDALEQAHALGLVHGRLTPDVIGVPAADSPLGAAAMVLNGLGLASIAHPGDFARDERAFISPEQLAGGEPDVQSDVFGLAAVLEFALHGDVRGADDPHARNTAAGVLRAARALDPRHRPASVRALWDEVLRALVAGASVSSDDRAEEGARARTAGDEPARTVPMPPTRWRRNARRLSGAGRVYAAWLALPLVAALGWPLARGGAHASAPTTTPALARTQATGGETVAVPLAAIAAPVPLVSHATPTANTPRSAERHAVGRPVTPPSHPTPPAPAPSATAAAPAPAAAPTNTAAPARIDVPTFIIIDAAQGHAATRSVARAGEFDDAVTRARKPQ